MMRKFATDSDSGRPAMGSHLLVVLGVNRPSVDETKMTLSSNDSSRRHERPLPARTERRVQQFSSSSFAFLPSRKVSKHFSRNTTSLPKRILSLRVFRSYEHFRDPSSIHQAPVTPGSTTSPAQPSHGRVTSLAGRLQQRKRRARQASRLRVSDHCSRRPSIRQQEELRHSSQLDTDIRHHSITQSPEFSTTFEHKLSSLT